MIKNPFNSENSSDKSSSPTLKSNRSEHTKKMDFHLAESKAMSHSDACTIESTAGDSAYLSAFHTRTSKVSLNSKEKTKILVTYLPLQFVKLNTRSPLTNPNA